MTTKETRDCIKCKEPMETGYIYCDETYCSDKCLHKDISEERWLREYTDDGDNYYTEWESIYLDD